MRWYLIIEEEPLGDLPTLYVEGEVVGYVDARGVERPAPDREDAVTREQLLAMPGGPDALQRWESRNDATYRRFMLARIEADNRPGEDERRLEGRPARLRLV